MSMGLSGSGGLNPQINVTPMIDVLLVLIIIFLLIQPHDQGLPAEVPQSSNPPEKTQQSDRLIVLEVTSGPDNKTIFRINATEVPKEKLEARLQDIYKSRQEKIMFVKGDPQLDFLTVAEVIDITRSADPDIRVGLITRDLANAD